MISLNRSGITLAREILCNGTRCPLKGAHAKRLQNGTVVL